MDFLFPPLPSSYLTRLWSQIPWPYLCEDQVRRGIVIKEIQSLRLSCSWYLSCWRDIYCMSKTKVTNYALFPLDFGIELFPFIAIDRHIGKSQPPQVVSKQIMNCPKNLKRRQRRQIHATVPVASLCGVLTHISLWPRVLENWAKLHLNKFAGFCLSQQLLLNHQGVPNVSIERGGILQQLMKDIYCKSSREQKLKFWSKWLFQVEYGTNHKQAVLAYQSLSSKVIQMVSPTLWKRIYSLCKFVGALLPHCIHLSSNTWGNLAIVGNISSRPVAGSGRSGGSKHIISALTLLIIFQELIFYSISSWEGT